VFAALATVLAQAVVLGNACRSRFHCHTSAMTTACACSQLMSPYGDRFGGASVTPSVAALDVIA
jgi:hypothetical protein